jgi:hypothetical protein
VADVRRTCLCLESTEAGQASSRYRKRKAAEAEKTQKDLDWARIQMGLLEADRDRLILENAKVQRRVEAMKNELDLFHSKVGRNTALGQALEEVKKEKDINATLHAANVALTAASAFHAENAARMHQQVSLRQAQTLELMAIRQHQCERYNMAMGSVEIVNGWPVGLMLARSLFGAEQHVEIAVSGVFNLFNLFMSCQKRYTMRLDHSCLLACDEARRAIRSMTLQQKKLDLVCRGLARGPVCVKLKDTPHECFFAYLLSFAHSL